MSETTGGIYGGASSAGAPDLASCEAAKWEEAGRLMGELFRRVPEWLRLPADVERHFQEAAIEQLKGVRAMVDYQIDCVSHFGQRRQGRRVIID